MKIGKAAICEDLRARRPAVCGYGKRLPDHEELIVLMRPSASVILLPFLRGKRILLFLSFC